MNIKGHFNRRNVFFVGRGTTALYLVLKSLELRPGSLVLFPSYSCLSIYLAVRFAGLHPVFCDVSRKTLVMTLNNIQRSLSKDIKVVIAVYQFGLSMDIEKIEEFCSENGIILIEDAVQGIGNTINKKPAGSFGLASIMSFGKNKPVDCDDGGAILLDDPDLYTKIKENANNLPAYEDTIMIYKKMYKIMEHAMEDLSEGNVDLFYKLFFKFNYFLAFEPQ